MESKRVGSKSQAGSQTDSERNGVLGQVGNSSKSMSADAMHAINRFASNVKALETAVRVGESLDRLRRPSGAESHANLSRAKLFQENSDGESRGPEMGTTIDSSGSFSRMIQQSSPALKALTRIQNSQSRIGMGNDLNSGRTRRSSGAAASGSGNKPS